MVAVMDRDRRLTGYLRGQTDNVTAPPGFELNNPWRVSFPSLLFFSVLHSLSVPFPRYYILLIWILLIFREQTEKRIY